MGKNPFIHDDDEPQSPAANPPPGPYRGRDRRRGDDRRKAHDRRQEIRFEPAKEDRRSGKDRRKRTGWEMVR